jgi:multicomponent Na+:H+ antiporter subunit D
VIARHLPVLIVVVPLISAPICVLLHDRRLVWGFATLVSWAAFATAIALVVRVMTGGTIHYHLGGWPPPWGIEYVIDPMSAFMLLIVSGIGAVTMIYAARSIPSEIPEKRIYLVYTMYLLCLTGLLGIVATGDAFNLFVFLEISSLSSYVLISLGRDRRALTASFQYLVMGTLGATFILIGIGLLYMMTGTLNMADLAQRLPQDTGLRTMLVALAFITVGASLKLALFPLHLWLPNAYTYAPSSVTVFLAATATKVSIYILLRFFFTIFGLHVPFEAVTLAWILLPLAVAGIYVASTVAIFQNNVKRLLAYSSVAQVGYMILGIGLANVTGLTGGIVHLFNHALIKGGLFMALGGVFLRLGSVRLDDMAGLAKRMPLTMAAFVAGGLSLIGVPLTSGFISKWYLVQGALDRGWWPVAILVLIGSLLAIVYVWRVVEVAYFRPPSAAAAAAREAPAAMLATTWLLIGANIYFGINSTVPVDVARQAAKVLLGGAP